jgi:hypothetical protein
MIELACLFILSIRNPPNDDSSVSNLGVLRSIFIWSRGFVPIFFIFSDDFIGSYPVYDGPNCMYEDLR